jgi:PAS domain S-box-containing protein
LLQQRLPGLLALNWVDDAGVIRMVVPEEDNRAALGVSLFDHPSPDVARALNAAARSATPARTPVVELLQGGAGVAFYWPVLADTGERLGFVNGVIRAADLVASSRIAEELGETFRISLGDADGVVAWSNAEPATTPWRLAVTQGLTVPGGPDLELVVAPLPATIVDVASGAQLAALLGISYVIAGLLALVTYLRSREQVRLAQSERKLREVMDLLPHPVYVRDDAGRFTFVNRALADAWGLEPGALLGGGFDRLPVSAEQARHLDQADRETLAAGTSTPVRQESFRDGQGEDRVLEMVRVPFRDPVNQVGSVLGIGVDITERLQSEAFGARIASALNHAGEAITVLDRDGTVVYANPAFVDMMGFSGRSVIGLPMAAFVATGSNDKALLKEIAATLERGETWKRRYSSLWTDGKDRVRDATVAPVRDAAGTTIGYIGVLRDVTREQQLEDELRQSQKLEAVGQLAGGIAHDFNNLLTVILGYASQLREHVAPHTVDGEAVIEIERAAERAADLTGRLLTFSRRGSRRAAVAHLNDVARSLGPMLTRLIGERVTVVLDLDPAVAEVAAATSELEQIIVNLCVNARDAMPEGGAITLWTMHREAGAASALVRPDLPAGRYAVLGVTDTGVGMPYEVQQRIFDPFFTTKQIGAGTGLGLSTVYGIAEQRGGGVQVESAPGRGSTLAVWLPVAAAQAAAAPLHEVPVRPPPTAGRTVLVVEDEEGIRQLAASALEQSGYRVLTAADGQAALEVCEALDDGLDVLVTDVVMPRMGGPELRERLIVRYPGMQVLFITGYAPQRQGAAAPLPGDMVLEKPFRTSELLRRVAQLLEAATQAVGQPAEGLPTATPRGSNG